MYFRLPSQSSDMSELEVFYGKNTLIYQIVIECLIIGYSILISINPTIFSKHSETTNIYSFIELFLIGNIALLSIDLIFLFVFILFKNKDKFYSLINSIMITTIFPLILVAGFMIGGLLKEMFLHI